MDTRNLFDARRHMRGAAKFAVVTVIAVFALLLIGAWFLIIEPHEELVMSDIGGHPSTPVSAATRTAPPPANVEAMGVDQLLSEARKAMTEQRYLAPAGNNAFEFYLKVLQKQPGNPVATDALRETFPFAANLAEQAINTRDFNEAQRQIDLLAQADPANFTLTILRSKLDAQRKVLDKQQQQTLDQQKAQQLAAQKAAAEKQAADRLAEQQKVQSAAPKAQPTRTQPQASAETAPAANDGNTADTANAGQNSDAVLLSGAVPKYPPAALRAHQSGWVVVAFTIDPDGRTSNVSVVSAEPRRVFDRAALDAVRRYRFTPAMKGGVAVPSNRQQKIEFNL